MNKTHQGILFAFILTSLPLAPALSTEAGQVPPDTGGQSGTLPSNSQSPILQDLFKSQFGQDQLVALGKTPSLEKLASSMSSDQKSATQSKLQSLENSTSDPKVLAQIAQGYDLLKAPAEMSRIGGRIQELEPQSSMGFTIDAAAAAQQGQYEKATSQAREALKHDPEDARAFTILKLTEGRVSANSTPSTTSKESNTPWGTQSYLAPKQQAESDLPVKPALTFRKGNAPPSPGQTSATLTNSPENTKGNSQVPANPSSSYSFGGLGMMGGAGLILGLLLVKVLGQEAHAGGFATAGTTAGLVVGLAVSPAPKVIPSPTTNTPPHAVKLVPVNRASLEGKITCPPDSVAVAIPSPQPGGMPGSPAQASPDEVLREEKCSAAEAKFRACNRLQDGKVRLACVKHVLATQGYDREYCPGRHDPRGSGGGGSAPMLNPRDPPPLAEVVCLPPESKRKGTGASEENLSKKEGEEKKEGEKGAARQGEAPSLPPGMTNNEFGSKVMKWGTGDAAARARIATLTREEMERAGVTLEMALQWRDFYRQEKLRVPQNPSAAGRAELMGRAVDLLGGP